MFIFQILRSLALWIWWRVNVIFYYIRGSVSPFIPCLTRSIIWVIFLFLFSSVFVVVLENDDRDIFDRLIILFAAPGNSFDYLAGVFAGGIIFTSAFSGIFDVFVTQNHIVKSQRRQSALIGSIILLFFAAIPLQLQAAHTGPNNDTAELLNPDNIIENLKFVFLFIYFFALTVTKSFSFLPRE